MYDVMFEKLLTTDKMSQIISIPPVSFRSVCLHNLAYKYSPLVSYFIYALFEAITNDLWRILIACYFTKLRFIFVSYDVLKSKRNMFSLESPRSGSPCYYGAN